MSNFGTASSNFHRLTANRVGVHAVVFAALWGILTGGQGWLPGLLFSLAAAVASCSLLAPTRWSLSGAVRFLPYFAWQSIRGGVDVALRAVRPALPIDPLMVRHALSLDDGSARVFITNVVTLLPGTLSAELEEHELVVHVLNADSWRPATLTDLENRVAMLFDLPRED